MASVGDIVLTLLRFLGLLEEPPPPRKNFKRNRVYDDFSSDDEMPDGYKQMKRLRQSDVIAMTDSHDKDVCDNHGRDNPLPIKGYYSKGYSTTSTPKEFSKRTAQVQLPSLSKNKPSTSSRKTTPVGHVIDAEVDLEAEESKVSWVESKTGKTENPALPHVDLDDNDSDYNQQDDDVVFVNEVSTPAKKQLEHFLAKSNLSADLTDEVLSIILEAMKSDENPYRELLRQLATSINPISTKKPVGDTNLGENAASFRLPQKNINVINKIKLHKDLNSDRHKNVPKNSSIRASLTDSSDSDVEVVPPDPTSTKSSTKNDSCRDIKNMARNWLLELDSKFNNKLHKTQENINDAHRVSVVPSKANSDQNVASSHRDDITETLSNTPLKFDSKYNNKRPLNKPNPQKPLEKLNITSGASNVTPNGNKKQDEASSSSNLETIDDWLAKLDAKYFSTPLKVPDRLNGVHQELSTVIKVNRDRNEGPSQKPDMARDKLSKLVSKFQVDLLNSQDNFNGASQEPQIITKVNTKLETTSEWLARLKAEYFTTPQKSPGSFSDGQKAQVKLDDALGKTDVIPKVKSIENEARSNLPAASRDWLSKLEAKYKTTPETNQDNLNVARQKLNNICKLNREQSEVRSHKLDSMNDWPAELKYKYNTELNDASREKENSRQNEICSVKLGSTEDWLAELKSKYNVQHENHNVTSQEVLFLSEDKSEQDEDYCNKLDTEEKGLSEQSTSEKLNDSHEEVTLLDENSENEARSFKFNSSEDLMLKLGSLYNKYQQETQEKKCKTRRESGDVNRELNHKHSTSSRESSVEVQANVELPILTPKQKRLVDRALNSSEEEEILVEKFNIQILRQDLQTLSGFNWLNDKVINFYMNLLMQRSEERQDLPKVYATNTFFYPKLMQSGQAGLRRWTRKIDIFAYDLIVVPVNIGCHWCLGLVDFRARIIKYLNSQGVPNQKCLDALLQYIKDEHEDKKGAPFDDSDWNTECTKDIPQQMNGSDCGMFACTFAEFSSRDAPYSFTQAHMPYLRRKAAFEILSAKLLL